MNILNQLAKTATDNTMESLEKFAGSMDPGLLQKGKAFMLNHGMGGMLSPSDDPMNALRISQQNVALMQQAQQAAKLQQMKTLGLGAGGLLAGGGIAAALMSRGKKRKEE